MAVKSFQEILAWQKARQLSKDIYEVFSQSKDYGFRDQVQRASVSVMNNIAEGYARQGNKSFRNYLLIAKGSAAEVESMLILANDLKYLTDSESEKLQGQAQEVQKILAGFIRSL